MEELVARVLPPPINVTDKALGPWTGDGDIESVPWEDVDKDAEDIEITTHVDSETPEPTTVAPVHIRDPGTHIFYGDTAATNNGK